ncbi:group I truncated hemoglobin [Desmospora profundinema]|uniref:Hemoglobin n=1 Tax=Desmospora profundinema TaxID=1571184 RepID=A0ABU1IKZ9_9BACL|nr:group 1 truncated hemoglobin [Desmospora profundinema]MDR6225232.1 hemoglobin [Desmospora profundinema]
MAPENLYEKLGGKEGVTAVVNEFYDRMIMDDRVNHYFLDTDTDALRNHQIDFFLKYVLGGSSHYKGNALRMVHKGLNISSEAYEIAIKHFNASLRKYDVPLEIRVQIEAFLRTVKPHIIEK